MTTNLPTSMTHIVGYGVLGREIARQLLAAGRAVTIIQRSRPKDLPAGARFVSADIMDSTAVLVATIGAEAIVCALGLPYFAELWEKGWPLAMANVLAACEAHGARLVFADNLYLYGPQNRPLTEDLQPVDYGRKPKARAEVTRLWMAAHAAGRVQAVAVRSPDFYGPGVVQSALGVASLQALAEGKTARLLGNADLPHDVAHLHDYARATITLLDAPADAYGQAWHVPTAPTLTLRQHLKIAADALGVPLKLSVVPGLGGAADRAVRALRPRRHRDAVPVRPALHRRCEQVQSPLLVGCRTVRDRACSDRLVVPPFAQRHRGASRHSALGASQCKLVPTISFVPSSPSSAAS
jgi:nucleoside-diphosphate-sugar epimerase